MFLSKTCPAHVWRRCRFLEWHSHLVLPDHERTCFFLKKCWSTTTTKRIATSQHLTLAPNKPSCTLAWGPKVGKSENSKSLSESTHWNQPTPSRSSLGLCTRFPAEIRESSQGWSTMLVAPVETASLGSCGIIHQSEEHVKDINQTWTWTTELYNLKHY